MRPDLDPAELTTDECQREIAALLATGLRRLRDRHALTSEHVPDSSPNRLEPVPSILLTDPVGERR
jgi:hypothetical protein